MCIRRVYYSMCVEIISSGNKRRAPENSNNNNNNRRNVDDNREAILDIVMEKHLNFLLSPYFTVAETRMIWCVLFWFSITLWAKNTLVYLMSCLKISDRIKWRSIIHSQLLSKMTSPKKKIGWEKNAHVTTRYSLSAKPHDAQHDAHFGKKHTRRTLRMKKESVHGNGAKRKDYSIFLCNLPEIWNAYAALQTIFKNDQGNGFWSIET